MAEGDTPRSREERDHRDPARFLGEHIPKKRKLEDHHDTQGKPKPGDPDFIVRARVPQPSNKDYVVRPNWAVVGEAPVKEVLSRNEERLQELAKKKKRKKQCAVDVSIEGRNMRL